MQRTTEKNNKFHPYSLPGKRHPFKKAHDSVSKGLRSGTTRFEWFHFNWIENCKSNEVKRMLQWRFRIQKKWKMSWVSEDTEIRDHFDKGIGIFCSDLAKQLHYRIKTNIRTSIAYEFPTRKKLLKRRFIKCFLWRIWVCSRQFSTPECHRQQWHYG